MLGGKCRLWCRREDGLPFLMGWHHPPFCPRPSSSQSPRHGTFDDRERSYRCMTAHWGQWGLWRNHLWAEGISGRTVRVTMSATWLPFLLPSIYFEVWPWALAPSPELVDVHLALSLMQRPAARRCSQSLPGESALSCKEVQWFLSLFADGRVSHITVNNYRCLSVWVPGHTQTHRHTDT